MQALSHIKKRKIRESGMDCADPSHQSAGGCSAALNMKFTVSPKELAEE
jgi:hypothetical protein